MKYINTRIPGVGVIESSGVGDERGMFARLFCVKELEDVIGDRKIVQINHSLTRNVGSVRGMHYQVPPFSEMKIVRCIKGRVFDVAVDIREDSPTYLKWESVELTPDNKYAFVIPEGCAHGFQVLEKNSELLYLHTAFYNPLSERGVRFDDPSIFINWPLKPQDLSKRDLSHPYIDNNFKGINL